MAKRKKQPSASPFPGLSRQARKAAPPPKPSAVRRVSSPAPKPDVTLRSKYTPKRSGHAQAITTRKQYHGYRKRQFKSYSRRYKQLQQPGKKSGRMTPAKQKALGRAWGRMDRRANREARRVYRGHLLQTWEKAGRLYPSDEMPSTGFLRANQRHGEFTGGRSLAAYVPDVGRGHKAIYTTRTARAYADPVGSTKGKGGRTRKQNFRFAKNVPLHEWAHTFQPEVRGVSETQRKLIQEGGAEAFEKWAAKKLKLKPGPTSRKYASYANWVKNYKTKDWTAKLQFSPKYGGTQALKSNRGTKRRYRKRRT